MTQVRIVKAGIASSIQDMGRLGYRAAGVPVSGGLDSDMLALANVVVGNARDEGVIEMLYSGVIVEACDGPLRLAIGGAQATIVRGDGATVTLPPWHSARLAAGERLRVDVIRDTAAAYLAVEGGFGVAPVLGSRSTHLRGGLGGWHGRTLKAGDLLPLRALPADRTERRLRHPPALVMPKSLRVMMGPHAGRFRPAALETFLGSSYVVAAASDRSGLRLDGAHLAHAGGYDLDSEGVVPGSIQVPGSGQPVILVADAPTVGGYPRIATVITADLSAAGRLRIGATVRFTAVDHAQALQALHDRERTLAQSAGSLADARAADEKKPGC